MTPEPPAALPTLVGELTDELESFARFVAMNCYDVWTPAGSEKSERAFEHLRRARVLIDKARAKEQIP